MSTCTSSKAAPPNSNTPYQILLPDLIGYCPFILHVNPHHEAAAAESDAWFDSFDIHRGPRHAEFKIAKFGLLTAMSYAQADYVHLRNCCDFMSWLFAFDDLTGEFR